MVEPYYQQNGVTLYHGDCREVLPQLEPVDLVLTDPPYGKVKGDFDEKWKNRPAMLESCEEWLDVIVPKMKFNATLYWFAWPSLAGRIEAAIAERLAVLSHIVWKKPSSNAQKASRGLLRAPMPESERVIMAEHRGADGWALGESGYMTKCDEARGEIFEPLREYLAGEWGRAGLTTVDCNKAAGSQMAGHYLSRIQWALPVAKVYAIMRERANRDGGNYLAREYSDLSQERDKLNRVYLAKKREFDGLRRYFEIGPDDPKTEIWEFPNERHRFAHPTVKPLGLIKFMARISCRPGGTILDPFAGSGTTLRAAKDLGREAVGVEMNEEFCEIIVKRLQQEVFEFGDPGES